MTEKKSIRIAFLTNGDARSRKSYSGTHYYMGQALIRNGFEVEFIGPLSPWEELIGGLINRASKIFLGKKFLYQRSPYIARRYAKMAQRKMRNKNFDFIFAPAASSAIAYLETKIPIIYTSDTSWNLLHNYYSKFSNILDISSRYNDITEKRAIDNAALILYPSAWVANSAVNFYEGNAKKISLIPWGANMDFIPPKELVLNRVRSGECRLFFVGVHWQRKGGDIAVQTLLELERAGVNASLTICGCVPPEPVYHPKIKVIPFLSKNDPEQRKQLENLFLESDFFLLPTRAECYGIVFSEAGSYGLPVITTNTGGVSSAVKEGVNGFLLPLTATGKDFAQTISKIYTDEKRYNELVKSSRKHYEEEINWDTWAQRMKAKLTDYSASHQDKKLKRTYPVTVGLHSELVEG